jgi:aminoglycoside phosphotransferase (APT) family kinase protein
MNKHRTALAEFIADQTGGKVIALEIGGKLGGGAIQENWALAVEIAGGPQSGRHDLVLRTDAATGVAESHTRAQEFALLKVAQGTGMTVPAPFWQEPMGRVIGKPFQIMQRVSGVAEPRLVLRQLSDLAETGAVEEPGEALVFRLGQEIAKLHRVTSAAVPADLAFLPRPGVALNAGRLADYRARLDRLPEPQPVLEWALNWIEDQMPPVDRIALCHRDFRLGNIMVAEGQLTGILDFEFAGWGDPDEDLGWFTARCWRFGAYDMEAGGVGSRAAFYAGYHDVSGRTVDDRRVRFWEIVAALRWALIALEQGERHFSGGERSINLALTGLRALECEYDLLHDIDAFDKAGAKASAETASGEA